jgi:hypothetical protein
MSRTLSTAPPEYPSINYAYLRQAGIARLERLVGRLWTDFNTHDPGVTILEQLCYALSDLGYRIDYDIRDLLASADVPLYRSLYSPAEILTSANVTLADLRRLLLDCDGVQNAWVMPTDTPEVVLYADPTDTGLYLEPASDRAALTLHGVYRVLVDSDLSRSGPELLAEVQALLSAQRGLAEQFEPPTLLRKQPITVTATVEIGSIEAPEQLLATIYAALAHSIAPRIRFYSLPEMLARGKRVDEIMDGPPLRRGFIDDDELQALERRPGLRSSDLIRVIMSLPGVRAVNGFSLSLAPHGRPEAWYLDLSQAAFKDTSPVLDIETPTFTTPAISLVRNGVPLQMHADALIAKFKQLRQATTAPVLPEAQRDIRLDPGRDRRIERYYSIQHQFPANYGIGEAGLSESASPQRKAQARQLQAYLLFFDQLLADQLAQLAHVGELFSFHTPQPQSYFSQPIDEPRLGLAPIWAEPDPQSRADRLQTMVEDPHSPTGAERKNRFLNHLLARFGEGFADYTAHSAAAINPTELIAAKSAFLADYRALGAARGQGFNTSIPAWGSANISGLQKRISLKLGIIDYRLRDLADLQAHDPGGFYIVEPILLRPQPADRSPVAQRRRQPGH